MVAVIGSDQSLQSLFPQLYFTAKEYSVPDCRELILHVGLCKLVKSATV